MKTPLFPIVSAHAYWLSHPGWRQALIILLLWGSFSSVVFGQTMQWGKTFGGNGYNVLSSLRQKGDAVYNLGSFFYKCINGKEDC